MTSPTAELRPEHEIVIENLSTFFQSKDKPRNEQQKQIVLSRQRSLRKLTAIVL